MTYLEFGEKKTEMDETETTVAEILDDLINSALDKIFQGENNLFFKMFFQKFCFRVESGSEIKDRKNQYMEKRPNRQYERDS